MQLAAVPSEHKTALKRRLLNEDSIRTDFRLTLMPTYLNVTVFPKVTVTLKRPIGKTQD